MAVAKLYSLHIHTVEKRSTPSLDDIIVLGRLLQVVMFGGRAAPAIRQVAKLGLALAVSSCICDKKDVFDDHHMWKGEQTEPWQLWSLNNGPQRPLTGV